MASPHNVPNRVHSFRGIVDTIPARGSGFLRVFGLTILCPDGDEVSVYAYDYAWVGTVETACGAHALATTTITTKRFAPFSQRFFFHLSLG